MFVLHAIGLALALRGEPEAQRRPPASSARIVELATEASWSFCHQKGYDGCELSPAFLNGRWDVTASPWVLDADGKSHCCVVDGDHFFLFSADGTFLGEQRGGP